MQQDRDGADARPACKQPLQCASSAGPAPSRDSPPTTPSGNTCRQVDGQQVSYVFDGVAVCFSTLNCIGRGQYGLVFRGTADGKPCAVKCTQEAQLDPETVQRWAAVLEESRGWESPAVITTIATARADGAIWQVMPLASGDLESMCGKVGMKQSCFYAARIAIGLDFLHRRGWVYRDLKPSNILIVSDQPKIADIEGMVRQGKLSHKPGGTWPYISPEAAKAIIADDLVREDFPRDVWSLGVVAFQLIQGQRPAPLNAPSRREVLRSVPRGEHSLQVYMQQNPGADEVVVANDIFYALLAAGWIAPEVSAVLPPAQDLIGACLRLAPAERPAVSLVAELFIRAWQIL
eukprot:TRINITY_DN40318_c0_g1_i1.p1 TRINITY_DN40318_c0_g1~~TRINITY_DN40318_c0_g1_i1.p1  ORF type:complete len:348 (+),score=85.01 TRINITY_DN40318_c0_g1_i1:498-1541(+)